MRRATYELWLADPFGNRIKLLRHWSKLAGFRKANTVGQLRLSVARSEIPPAYLVRDARLEVWRDGRLLLDAIWLLRGVKRATMKGGRRMLELLFFDQLDLLDGAIVAYPAGSVQAVKTGPADDLIKAYARENIGYLATDPNRNLSSYISIGADDGRAPIVYKTAPRRRLLGVFQDLARASTQLGTPLFFDLEPPTQRNTLFRLRTYTGQRGVDHRLGGLAPITLSADVGTLADVERTDDYSGEFSVVYAAGQGLEDQRLVVTLADNERLARSPFARRERFVDARHLAAIDSLSSEAAATLYQGRPLQQVVGTARDGFSTRWNYGDLVEAADAEEVTACRVDVVRFDIEPKCEAFTAELFDLAADSSGGVTIEQQIEQQGMAEGAQITPTPTAYAVPQANSLGLLADGWLSSAIARVGSPGAHAAQHKHGGSDEVATATPAANAIPKANASGWLDAWLSTTIARVSQLTWANITGKPTTLSGFGITDAVQNAGTAPSVQTGLDASKPAAGTAGRLYVASDTARIYRDSGSAWVLMGVVAWADVTGRPATFTPSAHAASHQNGGADEIATATPAANAIPKANASGDLADGWLSTNVPLKNTANTFTLAQSITVTDTNTASPITTLTLQHALSSGSAAAGFGVDLPINGHTTAGTNRNMALFRFTWVNAADASRTGRILFYVYDSVGAREAMRLESSGTAPMVGFNGVAAVARQSLAALTMSVGTGDNAVADVGAAFSQTTLNNNFRDVVDKINAIRTILVNVGIAV